MEQRVALTLLRQPLRVVLVLWYLYHLNTTRNLIADYSEDLALLDIIYARRRHSSEGIIERVMWNLLDGYKQRITALAKLGTIASGHIHAANNIEEIPCREKDNTADV